jgi:hypothetical protein
MRASNINKYFKRCTSCKGENYIWRESHDCWGRDDSYRVACTTCGGQGFNIVADLVKEIKQELRI